ncbi:MAG: hypothetical protein V7746_20285 [Halioglobus sp.]
MKIVLHIGVDKTGSTAIQQHLILNRAWLQQRSVYVPEIGFGVSNGHSALLSRLDEEQLAALQAEIEGAASAGYDVLLLSWEGMNFYTSAQIRSLAAVLGDFPCDVLVYLREQADLVQTGFLQQLKSNSNKRSLRLFESPRMGPEWLLSRRMKFPPTRDYYQLLTRWQQAIPQASFQIRFFDRAELLNEDIVEDFLLQLGVELDGDFRRRSDASNISLDVEAGILIDRCQREGKSHNDILRRVDVAISNIALCGPGSKYFLSEKTVNSIRGHYQKSNQALAGAFLGSDKPLFSHPRNCWRSDSWGELERAADVLDDELVAIEQTPTLNNAGAVDEVLPDIALVSGWHARDHRGAWSQGRHSVIRFRVWRRRIGPTCTGIVIMLQGRYADGNNVSTVSINGRSFPDASLAGRACRFEMPLETLLANEAVEITLTHTNPVTTGQGVDVALGLERVRYKYLNAPLS